MTTGRLAALDKATTALRDARAMSLAISSADVHLVWGDIRPVADVIFFKIVEAQEALHALEKDAGT